MMTGAYLLHFSPAYKHAKHYIGWASNIDRRIKLQMTGANKGSRLCAVVVAAGCEVKLARVWEGQDRNFERKLKNRKKASTLCPICEAERLARKGK